ncbi:MAG: hypothetical protein MJ245_03320 [Clostridia bacterium]|nr:hypothetical protein [Clostridia bacterium]
MKATRINKIKDKSMLNVPIEKDKYVIHNIKNANIMAGKIITSAIIFSLVSVLAFVAFLMIGFFTPALENYIVWVIAIDCTLFAIVLTFFIIRTSSKSIEATSTFATDKYNDILYRINVLINREIGFNLSGDVYSIPDLDTAIKDSRNYERITKDIELTKKNINVIDFWKGGDKVFEYSYLSFKKETDKYLYVKAYLTSKNGTSYDKPRKKTIKLSKKLNDLDTIRNICDRTIINV